jgi:hypothetical protein
LRQRPVCQTATPSEPKNLATSCRLDRNRVLRERGEIGGRGNQCFE